jgi:hypothetical protein
LVSKGVFTPFQKGMSQVPTPFENFILYPDRERVDFGRGKKKTVAFRSIREELVGSMMEMLRPLRIKPDSRLMITSRGVRSI